MIKPYYDPETRYTIATLAREDINIANEIIDKAKNKSACLFYDNTKRYSYAVITVLGEKVVFTFKYHDLYFSARINKLAYVLEDYKSVSVEEFSELYKLLHNNLYVDGYSFKTWAKSPKEDHFNHMVRKINNVALKASNEIIKSSPTTIKPTHEDKEMLVLNNVKPYNMSRLDIDKIFSKTYYFGETRINIQLIESGGIIVGVIVASQGKVLSFLANNDCVKNLKAKNNDEVFHKIYIDYNSKDMENQIMYYVAIESIRMHKYTNLEEK